MSTHKCPRDGCTVQCNSSTLACKPHWFTVSPVTRRELQSACRSGDLDEYMELRELAVQEMNHAR